MCTWIDLLLSHLYNDYWIKWIILNPYCESDGLNNATQTSIRRIKMHAANIIFIVPQRIFVLAKWVHKCIYSGRMRAENNNKSTHTLIAPTYILKIRCCVPYFLFVYAYAHTSRHNGSNNTWRALNAFVFHTSCMDFRRLFFSLAPRRRFSSLICVDSCMCARLCVCWGIVCFELLFCAPFPGPSISATMKCTPHSDLRVSLSNE